MSNSFRLYLYSNCFEITICLPCVVALCEQLVCGGIHKLRELSQQKKRTISSLDSSVNSVPAAFGSSKCCFTFTGVGIAFMGKSQYCFLQIAFVREPLYRLNVSMSPLF